MLDIKKINPPANGHNILSIRRSLYAHSQDGKSANPLLQSVIGVLNTSAITRCRGGLLCHEAAVSWSAINGTHCSYKISVSCPLMHIYAEMAERSGDVSLHSVILRP